MTQAQDNRSVLRHRVISFLSRHPDGVTRTGLHNITGSIKDIHEVIRVLVDEGLVEERMSRMDRGKPYRQYVIKTPVVPDPPAALSPTLIPGAREVILDTLRRNPGATRTDIWRKAIPTKKWIGHTLDVLVQDGTIREVLSTDSRGGIVRSYEIINPAEGVPAPEEHNTRQRA